jgi:hypothetical protein
VPDSGARKGVSGQEPGRRAGTAAHQHPRVYFALDRCLVACTRRMPEPALLSVLNIMTRRLTWLPCTTPHGLMPELQVDYDKARGGPRWFAVCFVPDSPAEYFAAQAVAPASAVRVLGSKTSVTDDQQAKTAARERTVVMAAACTAGADFAVLVRASEGAAACKLSMRTCLHMLAAVQACLYCAGPKRCCNQTPLPPHAMPTQVAPQPVESAWAAVLAVNGSKLSKADAGRAAEGGSATGGSYEPWLGDWWPSVAAKPAGPFDTDAGFVNRPVIVRDTLVATPMARVGGAGGARCLRCTRCLQLPSQRGSRRLNVRAHEEGLNVSPHSMLRGSQPSRSCHGPTA